jgi:hypothetical protein
MQDLDCIEKRFYLFNPWCHTGLFLKVQPDYTSSALDTTWQEAAVQYRGDGSGIVQDTRMPGYPQALGSSVVNACPSEWGNGAEVCIAILDNVLLRPLIRRTLEHAAAKALQSIPSVLHQLDASVRVPDQHGVMCCRGAPAFRTLRGRPMGQSGAVPCQPGAWMRGGQKERCGTAQSMCIPRRQPSMEG